MSVSRGRVRTILVAVGVIPAIAALALFGMVARMLVIQHSGENAYGEGHFLDAAGHFRSAGHHNWFEDWIAAFDAGAARQSYGQYAASIKAYQAALAFGVPHRDECTVRINMSLAWESIGDKAHARKKLNAANDAYQQGITALEDGKCPTDAGRGADQTKDGKTVDDRLRRKMQQNKSQQKQQKKKQQQKQRQKKQDKKKSKKQRQQEQKQKQQQQRKKRQQAKRREKKLRQHNQSGAKQRKKQQGQDDGYGVVPNW